MKSSVRTILSALTLTTSLFAAASAHAGGGDIGSSNLPVALENFAGRYKHVTPECIEKLTYNDNGRIYKGSPDVLIYPEKSDSVRDSYTLGIAGGALGGNFRLVPKTLKGVANGESLGLTYKGVTLRKNSISESENDGGIAVVLPFVSFKSRYMRIVDNGNLEFRGPVGVGPLDEQHMTCLLEKTAPTSWEDLAATIRTLNFSSVGFETYMRAKSTLAETSEQEKQSIQTATEILNSSRGK